MSQTRLLRVRCSTWEQVEAFYRRKLRRGGRLSMKVPFACELGTPVTLGLELPNQIVIAIDGTVASVGPAVGGRSPIDVSLFGLSAELLARLEALVGDAKAATSADDAGLDDERRLLAARGADLRRQRQLAAHEILGLPREASAVELRTAWLSVARREHPDAVARFGSPALTAVAEEGMILAARAYDRLRAAVVAAGRGAAVGPSVRPLASWSASDDPMASGFFAEAVTPPVEDGVELVDASMSYKLPSSAQLAALDRVQVDAAAAAAVGASAPLSMASLASPPLPEEPDAAADASPPPPADAEPAPLLPPPAPPPRAGRAASPSRMSEQSAAFALDELLPPVVTPVPPSGHVGVRWGGPSDLFADLDLGPATAGAAPIAMEESLAQARSGPGDRFVRQIRARLGAGDHGGAQEVAEAALHIYSGDRRLRGLHHVAIAMAACARVDRIAAVAALETALAHDPACLEAATALEQLRRSATPSAPAIQRLFA